jgi:uncharacterized pyridoxamine 5'-phosphate oxidase family protein
MEKTVINEIVRLLTENVNGCLATVENGKPRVRPFGFMMEEDGKLYFCTNSLKDVNKQLLAVPYVEYAATTKEMVTIRVSGEITFCDDIEIKEKVLNVYESVKLGYKQADNPIFKVFYIEHGSAIVADFSGQPPRKLNF